jgi:hypothetical protein
MMINTYNTFAQNLISNRPTAQKFSSNMDNPLLLSTPDALTFELINSLDSDDSGGLSQFESGLDNSNFSQVDKNSDSELGFSELVSQVANERDSYVELLFINAQYSAFNSLTEDGFMQMVSENSEGTSLMESVFQTQEPSDFQKIAAYNQNLLYHTRLSPAQPAQDEVFQDPSADIYDILAPLQTPEMLATTASLS